MSFHGIILTLLCSQQLDNNGNIQIPEVPEKSNDYDYYDQSQGSPRYMQAMRRNNPYASNRGVRSDDYDSGEDHLHFIELLS